jgi:hypothetical protein
VIPTVPDGAPAPERFVDSSGETNGEPADARGQSVRVRRLGEKMDVVGLHGVFDDPELGA